MPQKDTGRLGLLVTAGNSWRKVTHALRAASSPEVSSTVRADKQGTKGGSRTYSLLATAPVAG